MYAADADEFSVYSISIQFKLYFSIVQFILFIYSFIHMIRIVQFLFYSKYIAIPYHIFEKLIIIFYTWYYVFKLIIAMGFMIKDQ